MKYLKGIVGITLTTLGLLVSHAYLRNTSPLYNLFFSPSDLYEPLVSADLEGEPIDIEFGLTHRYPGFYQIKVDASASPGIGVKYTTDFETNISFRHDNREIISEVRSEPEFNYWRNTDGGVVLLTYRVPEQVPKDEEVNVTFKIYGNVGEFVEKYGPSTIKVSKMSDE